MPFGLKNASAIFQVMFDLILSELLGVCIIAYLNNLIIFSPDKTLHKKHFRQVNKKFYNANLNIKLSKCEFFNSKVSFFGNIILEDGYAACPSKTEAIFSWSPSSNCAELKGFLVIVKFLRKFCLGFSKLAVPLSAFSSEKVPSGWTSKFNDAFLEVKNIFVNPPLLVYANPEKQCILKTDAFQFAIGSVLLQVADGSREHLIAYFS